MKHRNFVVNRKVIRTLGKSYQSTFRRSNRKYSIFCRDSRGIFTQAAFSMHSNRLSLMYVCATFARVVVRRQERTARSVR